MTELYLTDLVDQGLLPSKEEIHWRAPEEERSPQSEQNEIIVFAEHVERGFRPPGSKKFRDLLHYASIHPQDLGANSIYNLARFQVFCEVYFQMEPSVPLFMEYFYFNGQTEYTNGPNTELGGVSIQRRKNTNFPDATPASHPTDWHKTWFYYRDTLPEGQNPLLGYYGHRLDGTIKLPGLSAADERSALTPIFSRIRALDAHGLTGLDLI